MSTLKNQRGVAIILELVLVGIAIAIFGFITYKTYQAKQTLPVAPTEKKISTPALDGKVNNYFYIQDLGIRFKLGPELTKQQLIKNSVSGPTSQDVIPYKLINFSTKFLQTSQCQWGLGALVRYEGVHDDAHQQDHAHYSAIYTFPKFHIILDDAHSACHTPELDKAATDAHTDFVESIKTMEPVN